MKFCCFGFLWLGSLTYAFQQDIELINKEDRSGLQQISSMARFGPFLGFLPQKENRLYFSFEDEVATALKKRRTQLEVGHVPLQGSAPKSGKGNGWEAMTFYENRKWLFLAHEDAVEGNHSIYVAEMEMSPLSVSNLRLWVALSAFAGDQDWNSAFEAIAWVEGRGLLVLSEVRDVALLIRSPDQIERLTLPRHGLRISDITVAKDTFLVSSFCHKSDGARCDQDENGQSLLRIASLSLFGTTLELRSQITLDPKLQKDEFNAEGLVLFNDGLLLSNDNIPPKDGVGTFLRYLSGEELGLLTKVVE